MDLVCNSWNVQSTVTELRKNQNYVIFYNALTRISFLGVGPFTMLAYFNYNIYHGIRPVRVLLEDSRHHVIGANRLAEARRQQENEAARILMGITAFFLICHALRVI